MKENLETVHEGETLGTFENKEEVVKFLSEAINHVESFDYSLFSSPRDERSRNREKLAKWLHSKLNISIKELKLNMADGKPYLIAEYLDENNELTEVSVDVQRWESNFK